MASSTSGRVVVEVDPSLKKSLRKALLDADMTLKDWFIKAATSFISERHQPTLFDKKAGK
ncbi:hypothetical protein ACFLSJ_01055 [Verrucomicrobiota bacterium]